MQMHRFTPRSFRIARVSLAGLLLVHTASAQSPLLPIDPGEVVATCHSGYNPYDPSDPTGYVVVLFDARDPVGNGAVLDQPWFTDFFHNEVAPTTAADIWNVANLGEVFGVSLDDQVPPNIYVSASTVYGKYEDTGGTNIGFGPAGGGGVYRLDGTTGDISICASLFNTGPGLGNVAHDDTHDQLYVSNFEDGLIYRIDALTCVVRDTFDHGLDGRPQEGLPTIPDDGMPGFSGFGRRIWGLDDFGGRLYYAVWNEDMGCHTFSPNFDPLRGCLDPLLVENEIWSVAIDPASGGFVAGSAQLEVSIPGMIDGAGGWPDNEVSNPVADIEFTASGKMLLAERSRLEDTGLGRTTGPPTSGAWDAHRSRVLEYTGSSGSWAMSPVSMYRIGWAYYATTQLSWNSSGGVAPDCDENVWASGDAIHFKFPTPVGRYVYGLQRIPSGGNAASTPYATSTSYLIDLDGITNSAGQVHKTQVGEVDIYAPACECLFTSNIDVECPPPGADGYSVSFDVTNMSGQTAEFALLTPIGGFTLDPDVIDIPTLPDGATTTVTTTVFGATPGEEICFRLTLATNNLEECCTGEVCVTLPECDCLVVVDSSAVCDAAGCVTYTATLQNYTGVDVEHIFLVLPSGVSASPDSFHFSGSPIPPFGTTTIVTTICGATPGEELCFLASMHDALLDECCAEELCFVVPQCDDGSGQDYCLTTRVVPCCPQTLTGNITLTICNTGTIDKTYDWSVDGLAPGGGCTATLPASAFTPPNGAVFVAAGSCMDVTISVDCTGLFGPAGPECANYGVTVTEQQGGEPYLCDGYVHAAMDDTAKHDDPAGIVDLPVGTARTLRFEVFDLDGDQGGVPYRIADFGPDGEFDHYLISLDGLPPGTPVTGMANATPGNPVIISVNARFDPEAPLGLLDVIGIDVDLDGDGLLERAAEIDVRAASSFNPPPGNRRLPPGNRRPPVSGGGAGTGSGG